MTDAAWAAFAAVGAAFIGWMSATTIQGMRLVREILGRKHEKTLREKFEEYHKENKSRLSQVETTLETVMEKVKEVDLVKEDIREIRSTIRSFHPGEAW